ncbi:MAG: hypothetical protein RBS42_05185 [Campylobacterales bacterium]|nr:hypothetical protein [Campylobacterales bacterium]
MNYMIFKLVHLLGFALWVGGTLAIFAVFKSKTHNPNFDSLKSILLYIVTVGALLSFSSGVGMVVENFYILKSDWFYLKLFLLIFFTIFIFYLGNLIFKKINTKEKSFNFPIYFYSFLTITIMFLAVFKPI